MSMPPAAVWPIATTTTDLTLVQGPAVLRGWSFAETTGSAAATAEIYDGADETTVLVTPISLAQGTMTTSRGSDTGIIIRTGLFLEMLTGSIKGAIYYTPLTRAYDIEWAMGEWDITELRHGA